MSGKPQTPRFPLALAKSGRQLAISISPAGCQAQGPSFHGERGLEGTVLAALWVEGQEKEKNFLLRLTRRGGRKRGKERVGVVQEQSVSLLTPRDSPGLRPPQEGGHTSTRVAGSERRAVPCLGSRPNSRCPPGAGGNARLRPHPTSLSGSGGGAEGVQKIDARPSGAPGRTHHPGLRPQLSRRAVS